MYPHLFSPFFFLGGCQVLHVQKFGKCEAFKAVPGHGLSCNVSEIEPAVSAMRSANKDRKASIDLDSEFDFCGDVSTAAVKSEALNVNKTLQVLIGNRDWMRKNNMGVSVRMDRDMKMQEVKGETAMLCAVNGMYVVSH
jgi:Cu+-exporting ATPase